jgi:hypothetical protein
MLKGRGRGAELGLKDPRLSDSQDQEGFKIDVPLSDILMIPEKRILEASK